VTTARAPACRECPGSHEQYLQLLKSTVTPLVQRVTDRKDTLGHGIRACLENIGPFRWATFSVGQMTFPPLRNRGGGHLYGITERNSHIQTGSTMVRLSSVQRGLANQRMARGTPARLTP